MDANDNNGLWSRQMEKVYLLDDDISQLATDIEILSELIEKKEFDLNFLVHHKSAQEDIRNRLLSKYQRSEEVEYDEKMRLRHLSMSQLIQLEKEEFSGFEAAEESQGLFTAADMDGKFKPVSRPTLLPNQSPNYGSDETSTSQPMRMGREDAVRDAYYRRNQPKEKFRACRRIRSSVGARARRSRRTVSYVTDSTDESDYGNTASAMARPTDWNEWLNAHYKWQMTAEGRNRLSGVEEHYRIEPVDKGIPPRKRNGDFPRHFWDASDEDSDDYHMIRVD